MFRPPGLLATRVVPTAGAFTLRAAVTLIHVTLNDATSVAHEQAANVVALDDALKSLEAIDPRQSKFVELRFFGGLSVDETAEVLKISPGTVMRDWTFARAWLKNEMSAGN